MLAPGDLPPPLPPPVSRTPALLACSLDASPCMPAVVLYDSKFQVLRYKIKTVCFFVFVFYVLFV